MKLRHLPLAISLLLLCLALFYISGYTSSFIAQKLIDAGLRKRNLPTIFAITPTYARLVQKAELTRLGNTFRQVPALHWIVVEDATEKSPLVTNFLKNLGIPYTHLFAKTPKGVFISRGTLQRNMGLSWLRETFYHEDAPPGVVYFADDDNTYSLEIFEEMRYTKKVSVWPVAFVGALRYETVNVSSNGEVVGWVVKYDPRRPFAIDMAGFAVNLNLILKKRKAVFRLDVGGGYQESSLLIDLVTMKELEPKADRCTKILVWHTKTMAPNVGSDRNFTDQKMEI
ncbi:galactosylgalactosylxylosylprotein 3-beta-glucuronosyltransferase 1-like [Gastrophryne carolinensis]